MSNSMHCLPPLEDKTDPVTLKDVARVARVSSQTVSRVVNNSPSVSACTRQKVMAVIEQLGYRPNFLARSLQKGRSRTIGVICSGLGLIKGTRIFRGIAAEAAHRGYSLLLEGLDSCETTEVAQALERLAERQVDGVIWTIPGRHNNLAWIEHIEHPANMLFTCVAPQPQLRTIGFNHYHGARLATQHLLSQGKKHIAHISGPQHIWESQERQRGWRDEMLAAGATQDQLLCIEAQWTPQTGQAALAQILDSNYPVDAIFASNDHTALGVLHEAYLRGLRIPDDLALVGFDDLGESAFYTPPLTTIHQDQVKIGSPCYSST